MTPTCSTFILDTWVLVHYCRWSETAQSIESKLSLTTAIPRPLICEVSIGEILSISRYRNWGKHKSNILKQMISSLNIINISNLGIYEKYSEIDAFSRSNGSKMGKNDLWIAATSIVYNCCLLTGDNDYNLLANNKILHRVLFDKTGAIIN